MAAQAPLIAPLLGLDGTVRYGALDLGPRQLRARMLQVLIEQLMGTAIQGTRSASGPRAGVEFLCGKFPFREIANQ